MPAKLTIRAGDILDESADALVCSANPHLRLSGGVGGAILLRGGEAVQKELDAHLAGLGRRWVERGSVAVTGPGPLRVRHILHAVAIDGHYRSDAGVIAQTLGEAFRVAAGLGAHSIALAALATGYGRLPFEEFARGLRAALADVPESIAEVRLVLRHEHEIAAVKAVLAADAWA